MKKILIFLITLNLIGSVLLQGYLHSHDLTPHSAYRRQLTATQQSHILTDVQQHQQQQHQQQQQHRFNPSLHKQFSVQQQPSIEVPAISQQYIDNQKPLPPNQIRFLQNNLRNNPSSTILQHHTQTNFVPNFNQQPQLNSQFQISSQNKVPTSSETISIKDNNFHAQNFVDLKNHYSQQEGPQQQQLQISSSHRNFIQSQIQSQPQPQLQIQQQNNPQFSSFLSTQFQLQNQQQNPQFPQNKFTESTNFQTLPQIRNNVQDQSNQPFQILPQFQTQAQQIQPTQQFQTAPIIRPVQQFQGQLHFQAAPQFPNPLPSFVDTSSFQTAPQISGATRLTTDQETKQQLVQKHEAFVQKQYEKQQNRVKQLHDEFIQKQQFLNLSANQRPLFDQTITIPKSRPLLQSEAHLFQHALNKYNEEHPTTTAITTTTSEKTKSGDESLDIFLQAQRKDIYGQLKLESEKSKTTKSSKDKAKPNKTVGRDELLKQLRLALAENPPLASQNKTYGSSDVILPNGQKVQVIRTSDPNILSGKQPAFSNILSSAQLTSNTRKTENRVAQINSNSENFKLDIPEQLKQVAPERSKDLVLPNGLKVEIVRAPGPNVNGGNIPEDISSLYSQNFGTEAQIITSDGDGPPSIEELARRGLIPEGYEIAGLSNSKLKAPIISQPKTTFSPKKKPTFVYLEEQSDGSFKVQGVKTSQNGETKTSGSEVDNILERIQKGDIKLPPNVKKVDFGADNRASLQSFTARPPFPILNFTQTNKVTLPNITASPYSKITPLINRENTAHQAAASNTHETTSVLENYNNRTTYTDVTSKLPRSTTTTSSPITEKLVSTASISENLDLSQILKLNGLFAMAKYLKQSGLDGILNETGPYTIFAPTDKAFKNLLKQLGGPERAADKFKANPRLLSGLLLHHVIPGSFEIASLQNEMTGVSLAGTQLRVNQYVMHDQEWNDILTTTINGAMIVNDKKDIKVPQGITHGVDRVMFPLPVGDILQTLQSDRENRFTTFLSILSASEMSELLQNKGVKTYTVFAPTDKAFGSVDPEDLKKLITEKDHAQAFIMRHVMPETLFSAGMRFYQIKDSLQPSKTITIQKTSSEKIKVNESQMITSNIPATNGVIHALDGVL